jgi:hypothetical protein
MRTTPNENLTALTQSSLVKLCQVIEEQTNYTFIPCILTDTEMNNSYIEYFRMRAILMGYDKKDIDKSVICGLILAQNYYIDIKEVNSKTSLTFNKDDLHTLMYVLEKEYPILYHRLNKKTFNTKDLNNIIQILYKIVV